MLGPALSLKPAPSSQQGATAEPRTPVRLHLFMAEILFPFLPASFLCLLQSTHEPLVNRALHPPVQSPGCAYGQMRPHNTARQGCFSMWPPPPGGPPGIPRYGLLLQHSPSLFLNHSSYPLITELKILPRKELSSPLKTETTACALLKCQAGSAEFTKTSRCLSLCPSAPGDAFTKAPSPSSACNFPLCHVGCTLLGVDISA